MRNFKRIAAAVSAIAIMSAVTTSSISVFAACEAYDFNSDGVVNSMDISVLHKYVTTNGGTKPIEINNAFDKYLEGIELSDEAKDKIAKAGDVNGDGKIDGYDRTDLVKVFFENGLYETDANQDGKLDGSDANYIADYYADSSVGKEDKYTAEEIEFLTANCEYDGDGVITAMDASFLMNYVEQCWQDAYKSGDTNLDGAVDALDASLILDYYSTIQAETEIEDDKFYGIFASTKHMGDINNDGSVDALDASMILSEYAKNQTK